MPYRDYEISSTSVFDRMLPFGEYSAAEPKFSSRDFEPLVSAKEGSGNLPLEHRICTFFEWQKTPIAEELEGRLSPIRHRM
jgi:hypothetical protein